MAATRSTNGFVLAGGQSRRMGRDKAALDWKGRPLVEHMVSLLGNVVERVQVVGRGGLPDRILGKGPLGGILTALDASTTEENLIVAVDLPLLTVDFLALLHSRFLQSPKNLIACRVNGVFPLCLGVRRALRAEVARRVANDDLSIQAFVEGTDAEVIEDGFKPSIFANANTPEDWNTLTKSGGIEGP